MTAELEELIEEALDGSGIYDKNERIWRSLPPEWVQEIKTEVLKALNGCAPSGEEERKKFFAFFAGNDKE